ncbi:MAG: cobalamin-independent methionine synthase II family protein [Chloroflexi bacterium]|nr:MAG: cobalamin-independent methionine synthase II family protein [Chloroflexota bacterium]
MDASSVKHNTDHIRVSHAGNLPRPDDLNDLLLHRETQAVRQRMPSAVSDVVQHQLDCGVDIPNDGEYIKAGSYTGYMQERVSGYEVLAVDASKPRKRAGVGERDRREFPGVYASGLWLSGSGGPVRPGFSTPGEPKPPQTERVCTGPVKYTAHAQIQSDVSTLKAAMQARNVEEGFLAALGPLSLGAVVRNEYYPSEDAYMMAVAEAVREEYKAITDGGLIVQVDEPEFATSWMFYPDWSVDQYRKYLEFCVEIINHALEGLPPERIRFHVCWGSGHRPHVNDIELRHFADLLLKIRADAYSIEAGNVRHAHEWRVWKDMKLPDGKILMPGVISHATDLVEHPDLVAERLINYASVIGKENVQAGTDCGIGSRVGHEEIVWAKLRASAEGARRASVQLWG